MVLSFILTISSCSKDDPNMPATVTSNKAYEITFLVGATQGTNASATMNLSDFTELGAYVKNVYKVELLNSSELTITGITAGGHVLKDAKLTLDGTKTVRNLTTLTADKTTTNSEDIDFLKQVANRIVSNKNAGVTFSISESAKDVNRTIPVKIKMDVIFHLR